MKNKITEDRSIVSEIEVSQGLFILFGCVGQLIFLRRDVLLLSLSLGSVSEQSLPLRHCIVVTYEEIEQCLLPTKQDNQYLRFSIVRNQSVVR